MINHYHNINPKYGNLGVISLDRKYINFKFKELTSDIGLIKDFEVSIGKLATKNWEEKCGPHPFPSMTALRDWDKKLLKRYQPFYMPYCDVCCICTYGKCDLTDNKRGACGIQISAQQSRMVLLATCIGAATHTSHARELIDHIIRNYGNNHKINIGGLDIEVEAPVTRLVCGIKPEKLGDLEIVLDYLEEEITGLLSAAHTGQEGDSLDFESKVLHAGMLDQVGMEVADIAQISAFNYPQADPNAPLVELGMGTIDKAKPVILVIGHNVLPSISIIDYIKKHGISGQVEVTGICCTAIDATRYSQSAKIIGPISWQTRYIRSGIPDVIVVDEQCIRTDALIEARKIHAPFIATSPKNCMGLIDRTNDTVDDIVADLVSEKMSGVLLLDPEKVGEVAVRVARAIAPMRKRKVVMLGSLEDIAKTCTQCKQCQRACPNDLRIPDSIRAVAHGDHGMINEIYDKCIGCVRCEQACPKKIPIYSMIVTAAAQKIRDEKFKIRAGRGAIQDVEIRKVGGPIVLGEIPGIVAFVGCANYPNGGEEVAEMSVEFAKRRYIVVTSGCAAMSISMYRDEEGKTPYEQYPGEFTAGGIVNVGSCVSNAHIAGATIKIASIFNKRNLRGNYEEVADYIYNRVGAVGIAWGAMSQKAAAIAMGFVRLGIPVIVGPHGSKYRRMLLGRADHEEDWYTYDCRTGEQVYVGPVPEHLFFAAETKEEAMMMASKLCMRPNDTSKGRAIKLTHYIDLHKRMFGTIPKDIPLYIRTLSDVPITMKNEIVMVLERSGWRERKALDPTLLERQIHKEV
ncbi:CO dehydrogenase/acetyl-CoA synthase complex subunit alpha [Methanocella conradii]|uniref:CO dehydrogenase/acetyl-CoA synthase complex subunit alpha n=1 Tax=Methanocella conradii TaxID=1175444 RepID=UPI00157DEA22